MTTSSVPNFAPRAFAPAVSSAADARWERWIPEWVRRIAMAVWVTGPGSRIVYLNAQAEALLGVTVGEALGRDCQSLVALRTSAGAKLCGTRCPLREADANDAAIPPVNARLCGKGRPEHWVEMTVIPVDGPDRSGRWMVHMARVDDRSHRLEQYVARVARRSEDLRRADGAAPKPLSPREREVLDLLASDVEPGRIAEELGLTYTTVRNHIQHLLAKLGAHSVEEAVAMHVLAS